MQKDKAGKFYLTKRKLQMRKKQSPPQKDGGDFEKEKYKKDFLLWPEWRAIASAAVQGISQL